MRKTLCAVGVVAVTAAVMTILAVPTFSAGAGGDETTVSGWWDIKREMKNYLIDPTAPFPAAVEAKSRLDSNSVESWYIRWDNRTGLVDRLSGKTRKRYQGSPEEIAREFLKEYRPLVTGLTSDIDNDNITFEFYRVYKRRQGGHRVSFIQNFEGVNVRHARIGIHIDSLGHIVSLTGNSYQLHDIDMNVLLTSEEAKDALRRAISPELVDTIAEVKLIVDPTDPPQLAYYIRAAVWIDESKYPFGFMLNPRTGKLLRTSHMTVFEQPERPIPRRARSNNDKANNSNEDEENTQHPIPLPIKIIRGSNMSISQYKQIMEHRLRSKNSLLNLNSQQSLRDSLFIEEDSLALPKDD